MNELTGGLDLPRSGTPEGVDPSRLWLEVVTSAGKAAAVEFRLRMEVVEVWCVNRCRGVLDRARLAAWLAEPGSELAVDDVALTSTVDLEQRLSISITLPDVQRWTLSPVEFVNLRERV